MTEPVHLGSIDVREAMPPEMVCECDFRITGYWRMAVARFLLWLTGRVLGTTFTLRVKSDD